MKRKALFVALALLGAFAFAQEQNANFVHVEGGTFQMGNENGRDGTLTVTVKSFYMSKYEVTQKEWFDVMGTTLRQQRDIAGKKLPIIGEGDNYPMYYVDWFDAIEYCNKLSLKEGLTPVYRGTNDDITCDWNANGYRLPTEAEWEFAAKDGIKKYLLTEYSGSNNADAVAWYKGNSGKKTHPIGTKTANNLGIYDMSGNVWEWCWDWYEYYSSEPQTDPRGPDYGTERILRGGSFNYTDMYIRTDYRGVYKPWNQSNDIGFRVVHN